MMTLDFKGEQVLHTVDFSFMIIDCNKHALEILYFNKSDRHVWILCDLQLLYTLCLRELFFYLLVGKCYCCLFLFTPVTCTMFGNFWQFFFIVSLHNLRLFKKYLPTFFLHFNQLSVYLMVCLMSFFQRFSSSTIPRFFWNYRLVLSNNWQVLGRVGGGSWSEKGAAAWLEVELCQHRSSLIV